MMEKRMSGKIELTKEECYCSIGDFYDLVAKKLGHNPATVGYDCRMICVTKPIQDQIFAFYEEQQGASIESIGMAWLGYGPKASLSYDGYFAEVADGFISRQNISRL